MKKCVFSIIIFISAILFYFNCNGDLLEEGPEGATADIKLRGIWIVGGLSGNGTNTVISEIDLYDPGTNTWHPTVTSVPTPVSFAAVASVNGKIYVIGGFDTNGVVQSLNQEYTISTNSWTNKSQIPAAAANIYGAVSENSIYILGGTTANANIAWAGSRTSQCYNTAFDTWSSAINIVPANGSERLTLSFGGVIYNLGGRTSATAVGTTYNGYVPITAVNTSLRALTQGRTGLAGAIYQYSNGIVRIFAIGGSFTLTNATGCYAFYPSDSICNPQSTFYYLDSPFNAASWTVSIPLPTSTAFGSAVISGTTLYFFGGTGSSPTALDNVYSIDVTVLTSWSSLTNMPRARYGHTAVTINQ